MSDMINQHTHTHTLEKIEKLHIYHVSFEPNLLNLKRIIKENREYCLM